MSMGERAGYVRRCSVTRRRTVRARARLITRHTPDGAILTVRRRSPARPAPSRGLSPYLMVLIALLIFVGSAAALRSGVTAAPPAGDCPVRMSAVTSAAGGHTLRLRAEPDRGGSSVVHLCADPSTGPIRHWTITAFPGATEVAAVQPVGERLALAVIPLPPDRSLDLTVDLITTAGAWLRFTCDLPAPA
ncbi:hypothetical protein [Actinoplanes sp. NPDC049265]|uniref:hypothetical protein n=1 Tax=Actinoplanes sp. NPDC049265 TaxID=3363902 RepID=UPI0037247E13